MSRIIKQLIYGFFFLLFFALAGTFFYYVYIRPSPSCFNGRQDRGEEGVDCGGNCAAACIPANLAPIEIREEPKVFNPLPNFVGVLVRIQNPNLNFASRNFNYRIDFYDDAGAVVTSRSGISFIYAGEIKYIADFASVENVAKISRAEIFAENPDWIPGERYPAPKISIQEKRTEVIGESVVASGRFLNQDFVDFPTVEIIAIFYDNFGLTVGVSKTEVENVKIGESRTFTVLHPFLNSVDTARTEYFVYARRP